MTTYINPHSQIAVLGIPRWLAEQKGLSWGAKATYTALAAGAVRNSGESYVTAKSIGEQIGLEERQVRNHLSELREVALIETTQMGQGLPSRTRFLMHRWCRQEVFHKPDLSPLPAMQDVAGLTTQDVAGLSSLTAITKPPPPPELSAEEIRAAVQAWWDLQPREAQPIAGVVTISKRLVNLHRRKAYPLTEMIEALNGAAYVSEEALDGRIRFARTNHRGAPGLAAPAPAEGPQRIDCDICGGSGWKWGSDDLAYRCDHEES